MIVDYFAMSSILSFVGESTSLSGVVNVGSKLPISRKVKSEIAPVLFYFKMRELDWYCMDKSSSSIISLNSSYYIA